MPLARCILETSQTQTPVSLKNWFLQRCLPISGQAYWPVHHASTVTWPSRIRIGVETSPGLMHGCYIQGMGGIEIGDYTQIACNVGLVSMNHLCEDTRRHKSVPAPSIVIGHYCWLGMNSVILPEVKLGDFTVVGAGAVVTKSFPKGYQVIAGNPARVTRELEPADCIPFASAYEYHGYIQQKKWEEFQSKNLELPQVLGPRPVALQSQPVQ